MQRAIRINWIDKFAETNLSGVFAELEKLGVIFDDDAPLVICGSINKQDKAIYALKEGKRVITYCWDFYKTARDGIGYSARVYNWHLYDYLLRHSLEVWVPSTAQQNRLYGWKIPSQVIHTAINVFDVPVSDKRFVLDHVRYYPEENFMWAERAGKELGIPVLHSEHQFSLEEFNQKIGEATFLICAYKEASTGGLPLVQALWNGKPVLVADSPYQGGNDYVGEFGTKFQYEDFYDLKDKMKQMFESPPVIDKEKARKFIKENFTNEVMALKIYNRLCELQKN